MARPKRPPRQRTVARQAKVLDEKLVRAKNRLLDLEPGGRAEHPIDVSTPAVIEPKARSVHCPRCDEPFEIQSHEARTIGNERLREAVLVCRVCGAGRSLWFRVVAPS